MAKIYECDFPNLENLFIRDLNPSIEQWQDRKALRMSGEGACLLLIPDLELAKGQVAVDIAAERAAYPGIAFRVQDSLNYELAYAQPHTSGKWDAIQYDPVFHGSNTWQLYHGPGSQQVAEVPQGNWFRFRVGFHNQRAIIQVNEQDPLIVSELAHHSTSGLVGLWTYQPAYFSNLEIFDDPPQEIHRVISVNKETDPGVITQWWLEGFGRVESEPGGILNLNRYLPVWVSEVKLSRDFEMVEDGELRIEFGFSDDLILQIDGEPIFTGEHIFKSSPTWEDSGYVSLENELDHQLNKGIHQLTAVLKSREHFGFGITLSLDGADYRILPIN
jgi:hypothetical protein